MRINDVVDDLTGTPVAEVRLSDVRVGATRLDAPWQLADLAGEGARNVRVEGNTLVCTVACRFGAAEGTYRFTVGAADRLPLVVETPARYTRLEGGCPSVQTGSTVDLRLRLKRP